MNEPEAAGDASALLATERLVLRCWRDDEAERLLDIRRRPEVGRWLSDPEPWSDTAMAVEAIAGWRELTLAAYPLGRWAIVPTATGIPAGSVGLTNLPESEEIEIGWYLHPDSMGRGYAREAAGAVLAHAAESRIPQVWAVMWAHNEASAQVATAIGMTDLGVREDPWYGTISDPLSQMFRSELTG